MNEHTRDLVIALTAGLIGVVLVLMMGCATPDKPFPEGDEVREPWGYELHCERFPDSIFCPEPIDE